jgi:sec-independent protein translocase protein TatA
MLLICDNMNKKGVVMFNFSMFELVVILAIALVVFGPAKLPDIGKAIGKGISNFKVSVNSEDDNHKS